MTEKLQMNAIFVLVKRNLQLVAKGTASMMIQPNFAIEKVSLSSIHKELLYQYNF